jgi:hypothetical protein
MRKEDKFLGRPIFDNDTRTWRFTDGSGVVPDELRIEMEMELNTGEGSWIRAWSKRWNWGKSPTQEKE